MIKLINDTIDHKDIDSLCDWLKTYPRLTKGDLTIEFEKEFCNWLGAKYSVFVNSGSSANLLMMYAAMIHFNITPGSKIVIPALSWSTDLSPAIQLGLNPIFCDCNFNNLAVCLDELEVIFKDYKPSILLLVSVLGLIPDLDQIRELCHEYNVLLLEDHCESLGSSIDGIKLGSDSIMATTSFYWGHHMSTIEGGMVFTNDKDIYNLLLSLRSHGWSRDWDSVLCKEMETKYNISDVNKEFTFYYPGFNLRSTDLQAFLGLNQLRKLDKFISKRNDNLIYYHNRLHQYNTLRLDSLEGISNYAYPLISKKRDEIYGALRVSKIETRPLIAGNLAMHPVAKNFISYEYMSCGYYASLVHSQGLYLPNHPGLTEEDLNKVCEVIEFCHTR